MSLSQQFGSPFFAQNKKVFTSSDHPATTTTTSQSSSSLMCDFWGSTVPDWSHMLANIRERLRAQKEGQAVGNHVVGLRDEVGLVGSKTMESDQDRSMMMDDDDKKGKDSNSDDSMQKTNVQYWQGHKGHIQRRKQVSFVEPELEIRNE